MSNYPYTDIIKEEIIAEKKKKDKNIKNDNFIEDDDFHKIFRKIQNDQQDMAKAFSKFMLRTNENLHELRELYELKEYEENDGTQS